MILILIFLYSSSNAQTFTLSGTVNDEEGAPIRNATVSIQEISVSTTTDKNGFFEFGNLAQGSYNLLISRSGYKSSNMSVKLDTENIDIHTVLEKSLIETQTIDITSTFSPTDISNTTYSVSSIEPRALSRNRGQDLAGTIENIQGVNNISTGSSIGKPVIRGLSDQSVLIVQDGVKHESQLWGDEHGPEISMFDIERIEILRGPASLVYGADGLGGVVNIVSKPLQFSTNRKLIKYGSADMNVFSMNQELAGNLLFGLGSSKLSMKGYAGYRNGKNINTPAGQLTVNTPEGQTTINGGELFNSGDKEAQFGGVFGMKEKFGTVTASANTFNRQIQLHENPDTDPSATPNQKIITSNAEIRSTMLISPKFTFEPNISYEYQSRKEFESIADKEKDNASLHLQLSVLQGDLQLHQKVNNSLTGTYGASFDIRSNRSLAEEKLIPNYNGNGFGLYVHGNLEKELFTLSGGVRFDYKKLDILETTMESDSAGRVLKKTDAANLHFNAFTGSVGAVYKPLGFIDLYVNIGRGWRPPSEYEMYVDGVHEGTNRYEKGLITLNPGYVPESESSVNLDAGVRIREKFFNAEASFFRNIVNNFVYPSPTGETDSASGLQIFDIRQGKSTFTGFEYSMQFQFTGWMLATVKGDYINTKNISTNNPLPFTPPSKNLLEIKFRKESLFKQLYNVYLEFGAKIVAAATKVDPLEAETNGYTVYDAGLGFDFMLSKSVTSLDLSVANLTDKKYVDHLSRYRYYAMNPGRSINLKIAVPFEF